MDAVNRRPWSIAAAMATAAVISLSGAGARAQGAAATMADLKRDQRNFTLDLTPPDLSAFALLGTNPSEVARPGTVRELAAALANGVSSSGQITPGLALEWAPGQTFGAATSLEEYRRTASWRRIAASLATVADGPAVRTAAGVRWVAIDDSDPRANQALAQRIEADLSTASTDRQRTDHLEFIKQRLLAKVNARRTAELMNTLFVWQPLPAATPTIADHCARLKAAIAPGQALDAEQERSLCEMSQRYVAILELERAAQAALDDLRATLKRRLKTFRDQAWNANSFELALGATGISGDGRWESLEVESLRSYLAMAMGAGDHFLGVARGDFGRFVEGPDRWTFAAGFRGLLGTPDGRGSVEIVGRFAEHSPDTVRMAIGGEILVAPSLWLELTIGDDAPTGDFGQGQMVFKANLKYGRPQETPAL
jgi:hypothetical protein